MIPWASCHSPIFVSFVESFDRLSVPLLPDMMDSIDKKIVIEFLTPSKALLTFPDSEVAKAVEKKYNGYRFGKSKLQVELHQWKVF